MLALKEKNGFSTVAITEDATPNGKLLGLVTSRDYRVTRMSTDVPVREFMTPREKLITAPAATTLKEANDIIWDNKLNALPVVDEDDHLMYFVFRKDYAEHKEHPLDLPGRRQALSGGCRHQLQGLRASASPRWSRPGQTSSASTPPRATPSGRRRPSTSSVKSTVTP